MLGYQSLQKTNFLPKLFRRNYMTNDKKNKLSPMMSQYIQTKENYKDAILFYRLGDFYEMFFEDAETCARELELTLTGRDCGLEKRAPMCGIPHHAAESYIARLLEKVIKLQFAISLLKHKKEKW